MNQENSALNFQLDQYRSTLKNISFKGLASTAVLTAGAVATYSNVADAAANFDEAAWLKDLKGSGSATVTITGKSGDAGSGKYEHLQVDAKDKDLSLELKSQQKLLISDTTHPYTSNTITSSNHNLTISGDGTIDVAAENAKSGDDFGMLFLGKGSEKSLNVDVGNLNVQSKVQIGTSGDKASASVSATNITIGNGKTTTDADKKNTYGQAVVVVGGSGGTGDKAFDGAGTSTFGNKSSNISVNSDGKLEVYNSKTDNKANTVQAANVSINGGALNFAAIKDGKGSSTYSALNTDVNSGYVAVKSGSNLTISGGDFNLHGKSHMSIDDNLTVNGATLSVDGTSVLAGASGSQSAKITLEGTAGSEGTLKLDKNKLNEFLSGMKSDKSAVQYADADEHYTNQKDVLKTAAAGKVVLGDKGGIEFTDKSVELADLKLSDKEATGSVFVSGDGFVRGSNVSISNKLANA